MAGYGWSPNNPNWWAGGMGGGGEGNYVYGYPYGPNAETDVTAQWTFREASGDIVDTVGSVTLADTGTPTYSVATGDKWINFVGITLGSGNYFDNAAAQAGLNIGTSDFTWEITALFTGSWSWQQLLFCQDGTLTHGWYLDVEDIGGIPKFKIDIRATDGTTVSGGISCPASMLSGANFDGLNHKVRVVGTRSASVEIFVDGVSAGSLSLAAISGKSVNCERMKIGAWAGGALGPFLGTFFEARLSNNNINNSGGPGGG